MSARSTTQRHVAADERERRVRPQDAREETCLAEDLEPVADPEHGAALVGELGDGVHRRREAGDRARAEVVAVREAAGEDDGVDPRELGLGVPDELGLGAERASSAQAASRSSFEPGKTRTPMRGRSSLTPGALAAELDLVALDQRIGEQALAHLLDLGAGILGGRLRRPRGRSPVRLARRRPGSRAGGASVRPPRPAGRGCRPSAGRARSPSPEHHVRIGEVVRRTRCR